MLQYWGGPFDGLLTIADASQVGTVVDVVFGAGVPGSYVVEVVSPFEKEFLLQKGTPQRAGGLTGHD